MSPAGTTTSGNEPVKRLFAENLRRYLHELTSRRSHPSEGEDPMRHVLVVFTEAKSGREEEFNEWYSGTHMPDALDVPGFVWGQRFELSRDDTGHGDAPRYLALYEIEGDPHEAMRRLEETRPYRQTRGTDSIELEPTRRWIYTAVCEPLTATR
jgi:hypothetical protein